jgi:tetratricopeptide (TPR) repeat protein
MSSGDWYRNTDWTPEIETAFNARLARSRSQKAQYLRIQGSTLKDTHPPAAIALLERCIRLGDEFHIPHAYLDLAHAHHVLGNVKQALQFLEAAVEQQERQPMFRTSAPFDFCMLVALHCRAERYDRALSILDGLDSGPFPVNEFQACAARAIILAERGRTEEARAAARLALEAEQREGWIPGLPEVGAVPCGGNPISDRLRAILASV